MTRKAKILLLLAVVAATFAAWHSVRAADDDFFLRQEIDVAGRILESLSGDFDGDGLIDLGVISSEPTGARKLYLFIQRQAGRFPPAASQTIDLSMSSYMAQVVNLDNDQKSEIVFIDSRGLWLYEFSGQQMEMRKDPMISETTIFANGLLGGLLMQGSVFTISGRVVALLPVSGGLSLWEYADGKFKALERLGFAHMTEVPDRPMKLFTAGGVNGHNGRTNSITMTFPDIVIGDSNRDNRDDIYLVWPTRVLIFQQNGSGKFGPKPASDFDFQEVSSENLCQAALVDFDLDGRLDLVCSRSEGGISSAKTNIRFFDANRIAAANGYEIHQITLTDACGNLMLGNFDNNGGLELVVPAIELGITSTMKTMVSKKIDFHLLIYPIDNLGRPAREPLVRKKMTCHLDFEKANPADDFRLNWSGDYNGDGLFDLVLCNGGGELMFFSGASGEYLENRAGLVIDISDPDVLRPVNLNTDGRSDLLVIHKTGPRSTRLTILVTNRIG